MRFDSKQTGSSWIVFPSRVTPEESADIACLMTLSCLARTLGLGISHTRDRASDLFSSSKNWGSYSYIDGDNHKVFQDRMRKCLLNSAAIGNRRPERKRLDNTAMKLGEATANPSKLGWPNEAKSRMVYKTEENEIR